MRRTGDITPGKIGFVLVRGFSLMSASAAIEPLRAANLLSERDLYALRFISVEGGPVQSSAGAFFDTEAIGDAALDLDLCFVVAGGDPLTERNRALETYLRKLWSSGCKLGGISGGSAIVAMAGLMENRRFTVHWRHFEPLREMSDRYLIERRLFVIDRDRYSCAGGIAALDMMHALIAEAYGTEFARDISDWFIHTTIRRWDEPQRAGPAERYGVQHAALIAAIELMQTHIADPLEINQLAMLSGIGTRQLQRLFTNAFGKTAMEFYREARLETADELLKQSALPVREVADATGFGNAAHFSKVFRRHFSMSPRERRSAARQDHAARSAE